jgi:hypothetical protein
MAEKNRKRPATHDRSVAMDEGAPARTVVAGSLGPDVLRAANDRLGWWIRTLDDVRLCSSSLLARRPFAGGLSSEPRPPVVWL